MKDQVEKELKSLILEHFNANIDKTDSLYLSGLMPRDMVKLVYLLESKYGIHFSEKELIEIKLDKFQDLVQAINYHIGNEVIL